MLSKCGTFMLIPEGLSNRTERWEEQGLTGAQTAGKKKKDAKGQTAGNSIVKLRNLYFLLRKNLGPLKGRGRTRVLQP